jgi:hypothetical protein
VDFGQAETAGEVDGSSDARDSRDSRRGDEPLPKDLAGESVISVDGMDLDVADGPSADYPIGIDALVARDAAGDLDGKNDVAVVSPPSCEEGKTQVCWSPSNPLVGACQKGKQTCGGGVWGPCSDIGPAPEQCNGIDDNCNGMIDEGCANDCLPVCQNCGGGATGQTFTTIEAAIAAAGPVDGGVRRRICVAGGTTCDDSDTYPIDGPLNISDGLIVQGGYALTANGLLYCGATPLPTTTIEFKNVNQGVVFHAGVGSAELSGFVIKRFSDTGSPATSSHENGAVLVDGGKNVSLSRIFISDQPLGTITYGVRISAGGQATIIGSSINGGHGISSIGVVVSDGSVNLRNNCDALVEGKCTSKCSDAGAMLGIWARPASGSPDAGAEAWAVVVSNTSGAESAFAGNLICGAVSAPGVPGP